MIMSKRAGKYLGVFLAVSLLMVGCGAQKKKKVSLDMASPEKVIVPVQCGEEFFYVDGNGKRVFSQVFEYAGSFSEGMAPVKKKGKFGYIDIRGNMVIEPEYEDAGNMSQGYAVVRKAGKYGYIDKNGEDAVAARYDGAKKYANGMARVE